MALPCGSMIGYCCGVVQKVFKTNTKTTVIMICEGGEKFVVTGFSNCKKIVEFSSVAVEGNVISVNCLKVQRFDLDRFNGQKIYQTKLNFEFILLQNSIIKIVSSGTKFIKNFKEMCSGGLFEFKCFLASSFLDFGDGFCAIVTDGEKNRADIFVHGKNVKPKLALANCGDGLNIKKGVVAIEDECINVKVNIEDISLLDTKTDVVELLTTPIKKKKIV
ncbi:hypothetical protein Mgra_00008139 [Meloidogyne graminicola]|uniref:Uncharacterized protein n=1 Tax=Meloidogyne graminicola TaxID=189291 RepID=A0A8S9ZGJ2_9BILA|nr:hypothetical protein Mgra_00008139 [Meloidogyne graminicola]